MFKNVVTDTITGVVSARNKSINALNCHAFYSVYQGQAFSTFKINEFYLDKKVGALTKTRKPFFF
jgi:ribosomal protein S19